jgi:hypothetical protein
MEIIGDSSLNCWVEILFAQNKQVTRYGASRFIRRHKTKPPGRMAAGLYFDSVSLRHTRGDRRIKPVTSDITNNTKNTKNMILAIPAAATDIPVKPKIAAIIATMKKMSAQFSIRRPPFVLFCPAQQARIGVDVSC